MNIKKLIEEIKLAEDELVDNFDTEIDGDQLSVEETATTEQLDAKTKVSRALDVLKSAVEDFKDSTVEELNVINDSMLFNYTETLEDTIKMIEGVLNGDMPKEAPVEEETEELEEIEADEEDEEDEEVDFDDEASLDLFQDEEEEDEEE